MKIVLDPGHGKNTNPYPDGIHCEGYQMYQLGYHLYYALKEMNFAVVMTRLQAADNPSLLERGNAATGADLFISLHSNASSNPETDRVVIIPTITNVDPVFRQFCQTIGDTVRNILICEGKTQIYERSYIDQKTGYPVDYYGVIRNAVAAGCKNSLIIEHSFHTNEEKAKMLSDDSVLQLLAKMEAEQIRSYIKGHVDPTYWGYPKDDVVTIERLWNILHDTGDE